MDHQVEYLFRLRLESMFFYGACLSHVGVRRLFVMQAKIGVEEEVSSCSDTAGAALNRS
jgi:hypothetical protein